MKAKNETPLSRRPRSLVCALVGLAVCWTGAAFAADAKPDLSGLWAPIGNIRLLKTVDGKAPPLRPEARTVYEHNVAQRKKGDLSFDRTTRCMPPGIPRVAYLAPFRIAQQPGLIVFLYQWNRNYRAVYIGAQHEFADDILFLGDSTAIWDGDTLVVDVKSLDDRTLLDDAMPHSENLHVTERYHLSNGGQTLVDEITFEDPDTFTAPWKTVVQFKKQPATDEVEEEVCSDRVTLFGEK